jgi:hypothetical protein
VIGRLKDGVPLTRAAREMSRIARRLDQGPRTDDRTGIVTLSYVDHVVSDYMGDDGLLMLTALFGLPALLVQLIACVNAANLLLGRTASRAHELAIRRALGSGRLRLMGQVLTEASLLALAGGVLDTLLAHWAVDGAPGATGLRVGRLSRSLAVLALALSCALAVAAALSVRSTLAARSHDPGFDPDDVLTARLDLPEGAYPQTVGIARESDAWRSSRQTSATGFYQAVPATLCALRFTSGVAVRDAGPRKALNVREAPGPHAPRGATVPA